MWMIASLTGSKSVLTFVPRILTQRCPLPSSAAGSYRSTFVARSRAAANQRHVAAAVDRGDRQTDGQTDTLSLHRRSSLEAGSVCSGGELKTKTECWEKNSADQEWRAWEWYWAVACDDADLRRTDSERERSYDDGAKIGSAWQRTGRPAGDRRWNLYEMTRANDEWCSSSSSSSIGAATIHHSTRRRPGRQHLYRQYRTFAPLRPVLRICKERTARTVNCCNYSYFV